MIKLRGFIVFFGLITAFPAQAIEMDFYTWGGFEETVSAFERLALFFADPVVITICMMLCAGSVVFGFWALGIAGWTGKQINVLDVLIPVLFGTVIFIAMVLKTDRLHIYDPVRNAYMPVDDVPNLVILLSGGLNQIERALADVTDSSSATPYSETGGALLYQLLSAVAKTDADDLYLHKSMVYYYNDCALPAFGNGESKQSLRRATWDVYDEFAKYQNPSFFTTYYPPGSSVSESRSCTDAWSGTNGLASRLSDPNTFTQYKETVCGMAGFNVGDMAQMAQCDSALSDAQNLYGAPTPSGAIPLMRTAMLSHAVSDAMQSADLSRGQRAMIDRQVMAEGFGALEALGQWVPKLRAFMLAISLGIACIVILFFMTPLFKAAIMLFIGLFAWLTIWGICDVMALVMVNDAAMDAMSQINRYQMGVDAILMTPEGAVQALGIFGKARGTAMIMALVVSAALFKFGGYALASQAMQHQSHLDQIGEKSGRDTLLPEERAAFQGRLLGSQGPQSSISAQGFGNSQFAHSMQEQRMGAEGSGYVNPSLGGHQTLMDQGQMTAGQRLGEASGLRDSGFYTNPELGGNNTLLGASAASSQAGKTVEHGRLAGQKEASEGLFTNGLRESSELEGGLHAAGTSVKDDIYTNVAGAGAKTPSGLKSTQELENASILGASKVVTPDQQTDRFSTETLTAVSRADAIEAYGNPVGVGRGQGIGEVVSAKTTERLHGEYGTEGMVDGGAYPSAKNIEGVRAAGGDPISLAGQTGPASIARELSHAEMQARTAETLGLDPRSLDGLIQAENTQSGSHVRLAITPENMDEMLPKIAASGPNGIAMASELAEQGGGVWDMTVAPNSEGGFEILSGTVSTGHAGNVNEQMASRSGITNVEEHSLTKRGGTVWLEDTALTQSLISDVYAGNVRAGEIDENALNQSAGVISQALREAGTDLGTSSGVSIINQWSANAGLGIGGKGISLGGSGEHRESASDSGSLTQNSIAFSRAMIETAVDNARLQTENEIAEYQERHGNALILDEDAINQRVLNLASGNLRESFSELKRFADENSEDAWRANPTRNILDNEREEQAYMDSKRSLSEADDFMSNKMNNPDYGER